MVKEYIKKSDNLGRDYLIYKDLYESDKRDSNPRPSAWEADALPTELLSRLLCKDKEKSWKLERVRERMLIEVGLLKESW